MPGKAHFKVTGKLDGTHTMEGTITVHRQSGLITVRPKHKRQTYTLPLDFVAEMIVWHVIKESVRGTQVEKKPKKTKALPL